MKDKNRKMRCSFCIKELVLGYVIPNKDYTLCENCAFKNEEHTLYSYVHSSTEQYDISKEDK